METVWIFVGGLTDDQWQERDAIERAISSLRVESVRIALEFSTGDWSSIEIENRLYRCGVFLGVYDRTRYGRVLPAENISVAEFEFDKARESKKPTLVFVRRAPEIERSPHQIEFIGRIIDLAANQYSVLDFETPDHLESLVAGSLKDMLIERFYLKVTRPPFQVPRQCEGFIERMEPLQQVIAAIAPGKPIVIHGLGDVGGLGKTQLAIRAAHTLRATFPDGVLWANLAVARSVDVLTDWARQYGGLDALGRGDLRFVFRPLSLEARRLAEVTARIEALRDRLRGKRVLAILDGLVDERDQEQIEPLLRALDNVTVIVTSRSSRIPAVRSATFVELKRLTTDEAEALFARVAGVENPAIDHVQIMRLGNAVDFLPMALNLAATLWRTTYAQSLGTLTQIIEHERSVLEEQRWGYAAIRGVQAAMNVSHRLLNADQARFFSALGAFAGDDFDAPAAAFVTDTSPVSASKSLEHLVKLAFVQPGRRAGRYSLHPVIRAFARDQAKSDETDEKMATFYCALAHENGKKLESAEVHSALVSLDLELNNIIAGHRWAKSRNDRMGWQLCRDYVYGAMIYYFNLKSMWSDWIDWSAIGILACQKLGDEESASRIAGGLGLVYYRKGEFNQAMEFYKQALTTMERLHHAAGIAAIYMNLGNVQTERREWLAAIESYGKALQLYEQLGNLHGLGQTRANLGMLYAKYGDKPKARANWVQALEIFEHLGRDREADIVRQWLKGIAPSAF